MKNVKDLFSTIVGVAHFNSDKTIRFSARRINSAFEVTVSDTVTDAVMKTYFIGELKGVEFNDRLRWAIVEKRGSKIRCLKKTASADECLKALNALLKPYGSYGFSWGELVQVVVE